MKANDEAKNILVGKTCEECNHFKKEYTEKIILSDDETYENYCTIKHDQVHVHDSCRDWKEYDPSHQVLSQAEIDMLLTVISGPATEETKQKADYIESLDDDEIEDYIKQLEENKKQYRQNVLSQEDIDALLAAAKILDGSKSSNN